MSIPKRHGLLNHRERNITHALFVLPNLVLYTVFSVFPILMGIYYSMTNWNGITRSYSFIGLKNYATMFSNTRFHRALSFNLRYVILYIVCTLILSVVLGLLLTRRIKGQSFFRSIYFFPAVIGMLSCGLIFRQIFGNALPTVGEHLGISALQKNILSHPQYAMYGILFVNLWQGVSIPTVLIIAGLQTIPQELQESASLDGASALQFFRYITIPFLLPSMTMIGILALKEGLMIYDYVLALTDGGPAGRTESLTMLIMKQGFNEQRFSLAIAESILLAIVIIIISAIQIEFTNKRKVYE